MRCGVQVLLSVHLRVGKARDPLLQKSYAGVINTFHANCRQIEPILASSNTLRTLCQ